MLVKNFDIIDEAYYNSKNYFLSEEMAQKCADSLNKEFLKIRRELEKEQKGV
ncbi:hypothetical protein [Streptobacillus moniliformis]|uniref:hypothetical protein n=1 Tax=Streptobacillus moniliformis TaxID=34105 RepID=UPI000AE3834F|nr:hypothetical protein [Streptobacillus moniliformis]